jgi:hypothetical protein
MKKSGVGSQEPEARPCHSEPNPGPGGPGRSEESQQLFSSPIKLPGFFASPRMTHPRSIKAGSADHRPAAHSLQATGRFWCAEHARQLEGESPFDNLMEVKS